MQEALFSLDSTLRHDPAIDAWLAAQPGELGEMARSWFAVMRSCGDEVCEIVHDGCPVACFGLFPFAYVNVFRAHANVGFYQGWALPDPAHLLEGSGKRMRHVKLRPGTAINDEALRTLILTAYADIKARVEQS